MALLHRLAPLGFSITVSFMTQTQTLRRILFLMVIALATAAGSVGKAQALYPKETETYLINYYAFSKQSSTAYMLSVLPGFGAGHFYAENWVQGAVFGIGQALGLGLFLIGNSLDGSARTVLNVTGGVLFTGFKLGDIFTAPSSAEQYNRRLAARLKLKPLVLFNPNRSQPAVYGLALSTAFAP